MRVAGAESKARARKIDANVLLLTGNAIKTASLEPRDSNEWQPAGGERRPNHSERTMLREWRDRIGKHGARSAVTRSVRRGGGFQVARSGAAFRNIFWAVQLKYNAQSTAITGHSLKSTGLREVQLSCCQLNASMGCFNKI
jgi:hypothetical protein